MAHKFTLEIELGNAAMSTPLNVARALDTVAARLRNGEREGRIRDVNGNTCGTWAIAHDTGEACAKCGRPSGEGAIQQTNRDTGDRRVLCVACHNALTSDGDSS